MKKSLLFIQCLMFLLQSCEKDDNTFTPTLPLITTTGENTFGCYVDGILVTPRNGASSELGFARGMKYTVNPPSATVNYNEIIVQDHISDPKGLVTIHLPDLVNNGEGVYIIKNSNCFSGVNANNTFNITALIRKNPNEDYTRYCSIEGTEEIIISRYDFENRIISGVFSCHAVNKDNLEEIIKITEGRFDIKWDILNTTFVDFP